MSTDFDPQPADEHWSLLPDEAPADPIARGAVRRRSENAVRRSDDGRAANRIPAGDGAANGPADRAGDTGTAGRMVPARIGRHRKRIRRAAASGRWRVTRSKAPPPSDNSSTPRSRPTNNPRPGCGWPNRRSKRSAGRPRPFSTATSTSPPSSSKSSACKSTPGGPRLARSRKKPASCSDNGSSSPPR